MDATHNLTFAVAGRDYHDIELAAVAVIAEYTHWTTQRSRQHLTTANIKVWPMQDGYEANIEVDV